ncbi:MAG TPA: hypothetical protein VMX17_10020 [Candidatus Glassbacteria bacterium]|nr:hypothetical protein [Candidatus Glassbacteria bacterium]
MSNVKDEAEVLEITGTLSLNEEISKKYDELSKKIDKILNKKKKVCKKI